jgi:hypothetical protein
LSFILVFCLGLFSWSFVLVFSFLLCLVAFVVVFALVFCLGLLSWSFVLVFCVGRLCWSFVLVFCLGLLSWSFVLVFGLGLLPWSFVLVFCSWFLVLFLGSYLVILVLQKTYVHDIRRRSVFFDTCVVDKACNSLGDASFMHDTSIETKIAPSDIANVSFWFLNVY